MPLIEQLENMPLDKRVATYHDRCRQQNYYDMMELSKTATSREIEMSHERYLRAFPSIQMSQLGNDTLREQMTFIIHRLYNAFTTLNDFKKRTAYEKRGFKEADEVQEVFEAPTDKAKVYYKKAKTLLSMKDYEKAVMVIKEAIKLDASNPSFFLLLGQCQMEVPRMRRDAETNLLKASQMEDWNAEPYVMLGMLFCSERLYARAENYFRKALELEPYHAIARRKLDEISIPQKKGLLGFLNPLWKPLRGILAKVLPSFFGSKR